MTFLLSLLARPAVFAGVIGTGALVGFAVYHVKVTDGARERYIERMEADIASKAATIANQELSIAAERLSVRTLQRAVSSRNHEIEQKALQLKNVQLTAARTASQAFAEGMASVKVLAASSSPVKSDAPAMNAWMAETFGGVP